MIFNKCISLATSLTGIYFNILNINNQLDFYVIYYISFVIVLNSEGDGCHVNFRWLSVVIIKKK